MAIEVEMAFQEQVIAFVRAFGLHRPDQTPYGEPVSVAEAHALMELSRHGGLSQKGLGQWLRLEKSTVSRLVSILERKGWVTRTHSAQDGRLHEHYLTEEGRRIAQQLARAREQKFARILSMLPDDQHAHVTQALQKLIEAIYESEQHE